MATPSSLSSPLAPRVNLLDLATAATACTVAAASAIRQIAHPTDIGQKNARFKADGSVVTDADFAAQGIICQAIQSVSSDVMIVGEESPEEMAEHIGAYEGPTEELMERTRKELWMRYLNDASTADPLPLAVGSTWEDKGEKYNAPEEMMVDASRIRVIVDPLDGTKSYALGEYDAVSILIAIIVDDDPCFGVIGKPFGYSGITPMLNGDCAAIYGGPLLKGAYVAGGEPLKPKTYDGSLLEELPRAVISGSRSKGIVHDFCIMLGEKGLIFPEPMHVNGAGEKSVRLMLPKENEALWFFPKPGTSRWDVAAPDALLRSLGGRLTDKYGRNMDYSKSREEAENVDGVVACIDAELHAKCIELFKSEGWLDR